MFFSKRNPLLRKNVNDLNTVIGSLGDEITEYDMESINGGSTDICKPISVELITIAIGCLSQTNVINK